MTTKTDNRSISKDFIDDFKTGKPLAKVLDYIKNPKNELILCFRGNSGNIATIYKKNHVFCSIQKLQKGVEQFKMSFNFNHARYSKNWESVLKELVSHGWKTKHTFKDVYETNIDIGVITKHFNTLDDSTFKKSFTIINNLIEDYFDQYKNIDYFTGRTLKHKGVNLEKQRQQELFETYKKPADGNGYFIYDLEFVEQGNRKGNQPDFWAVKYVKGTPKHLVLGEIKSRGSALNGQSGLAAHLQAMIDYAKSDAIENRKTEALNILKDYATLNLYGLEEKDYATFEQIILDDTVEICVVFTDEVAECYEQFCIEEIKKLPYPIQTFKFFGKPNAPLSKPEFDNIILKNHVAKEGKDIFGYEVGDDRIYKNYYTKEEFLKFKDEMPDAHKSEYDDGSGSELTPYTRNGKLIPPKMACVASSSRFCYLALKDGSTAINATGTPKFEKKCPISNINNGYPPHLDAYFKNENIYIEAKCHEIFDDHKHELKISYWNNIFDTDSKDLKTFALPKPEIKPKEYFNIPFKIFGYDKTPARFDFKQFLCNLLGIACNVDNRPATLVYLFFKPKDDNNQARINKVFNELSTEIRIAFNNTYIKEFCNKNNITLKAVAEFSKTMETLTSKNIEYLYTKS